MNKQEDFASRHTASQGPHDPGHKHRNQSPGSQVVDFLEPEPDDAMLAESLRDNPIWQQENVTLRSVGIDIGSSGTQLVFTELKLKRNGAGLATRYVVVERNCLYESVVAFTPFTDTGTIDARALGTIIDEAYRNAGIEPKSVDTGIVILTGEALRRENAQNIATVVSETAGDFVCATAGHHMEATLAAYGSGAVDASRDKSQRLLNIDIGGGTTKLSLVDKGNIVSTAALHVGGRLIVTEDSGLITRLEDAAIDHGQAIGLALKLGDTITSRDLDRLGEYMVDLIIKAVDPDQTDVVLAYLTDPISSLFEVQGVIFSGGVSEYVYAREERDFGDLGKRIGLGLRKRLEHNMLPYDLIPATARIRATALGASEFCVQLSGNTCYLDDAKNILPRRNLQVIHPHYVLATEIDINKVAGAIRNHIEKFAVSEVDKDLVLALNWTGELSYSRLFAMANAIVKGLAERIDSGLAVLITFDADMAKSLGAMLRDELGVRNEILIVDGITLWDFDYIDLGAPLEPSKAIPVTIKSLVF